MALLLTPPAAAAAQPRDQSWGVIDVGVNGVGKKSGECSPVSWVARVAVSATSLNSRSAFLAMFLGLRQWEDAATAEDQGDCSKEFPGSDSRAWEQILAQAYPRPR